MKKLKIFILFLTFLIPLFFGTITTKALSFQQTIKTEVASLVSIGELPAWHNELSEDPGYQTFYNKMYRTASPTTKIQFINMTKDNMLYTISFYGNQSNQVWDDVLSNLDIEPKNLEPNKILGIYWDPLAFDSAQYLYLFWTTEYIPSEFMNIEEMVLNNKTYKLHNSIGDLINGNSNWQYYDYYHYPEDNLTIQRTIIGGYEYGKHFGVPLTQTYHFKSFKATLDDTTYNQSIIKDYQTSCNTEVLFNLSKTPTKDGQRLCQLVTHAYELIRDCEVQSYLDMGFGGYIHQAVFNTTIAIDKIYRVDVAYTLSSENKNWYEFWLNTKEVDVTKSLTAQKKANGLFNLFAYQGFKEGIFQSNIKSSKTYKYKLHLNYDEECWNLFDNPPYYEADYKVVKNFRILRLNYLVDNKVYDVAIKMDTVDGDTLNIIDRDLILDTDTTLWNVKDKVYDGLDKLSDKLGQTGKNIVIALSMTLAIIVLYYLYKLITLIKVFLKQKERIKK